MKQDMLFIPIPETVLPGGMVVPAFEVGKYHCTKDAKGNAAVSYNAFPWVNVNFEEAKAACKKAGYALITETQALALAYHIATQDENWTGGQVGNGLLFQGLRKGTARNAMSGNCESKDPDERRWFALPSGERIFDVAGNIYTWIFDDVQGNEQGIIANSFAADSPSLVIPYPAEGKGQGWTPRAGSNWSGFALVRGGYWCSESNAGVFRLRDDWPGARSGIVGFRCTKPIGL